MRPPQHSIDVIGFEYRHSAGPPNFGCCTLSCNVADEVCILCPVNREMPRSSFANMLIFLLQRDSSAQLTACLLRHMKSR
jgi:hypothetical protein